MWIVYYKSIIIEVPTETEAIEYCNEHEGYRYYYVPDR